MSDVVVDARDAIGPAPVVAALAVKTPFVGPEALGRRIGRADFVRLGANESVFGASPLALAAMHEALARVSFYGDPESFELRSALATKHGCDVAEVAVGSGIDDLLGTIARTYLAPGDVAVAAHGSYPTFVFHAVGYGARLETVAYRRDGTVPLDDLAAKARERDARLVYLANPDNPSGTFATRDAVDAFLEALPEATMLVLDEAYADFVDASELVRDGVHPRVIRTRTFSKAYGMAGARVGYALAPRGVVATFDKIRHHFGVNRIAQGGALAALADDAFVARVVAEVARGRAEYAAIARETGCATIASSTNFLCIDLGSRARAEAMVEALLHRGVFVRKPGLPPLDGYIRVTVGAAVERRAFGDAFVDAFAELGSNPDRSA